MLSYAISDPGTLRFDRLEADIVRFAEQSDMILYRDKQNIDYARNAERFMTVAKRYMFQKVLLHNDILLAESLQADGIHLSSDSFSKITLAKEKGLFVIVSTHTLNEAVKAESLGADMVTFSPVFSSPGKAEPVGLEKLGEVCAAVKIPVIALGGILTSEQINACQNAGAKAFASIRYFK